MLAKSVAYKAKTHFACSGDNSVIEFVKKEFRSQVGTALILLREIKDNECVNHTFCYSRTNARADKLMDLMQLVCDEFSLREKDTRCEM